MPPVERCHISSVYRLPPSFQCQSLISLIESPPSSRLILDRPDPRLLAVHVALEELLAWLTRLRVSLHVEHAQAPRPVVRKIHKLVVRRRLQISETLHLRDDVLIFRFLPGGIRGVPTRIVHENPVAAVGHLAEVLQVLIRAFGGVVAIHGEQVALDVGIAAMELRDREAAISEGQEEALREQLSGQLSLPQGVVELAQVEGPHTRPRVRVQVDGGAVPGVEAHFADVFYQRRAGDLEVHLQCFARGGDVAFSIHEIPSALAVEEQSQRLGVFIGRLFPPLVLSGNVDEIGGIVGVLGLS